MKVVVRRLRLDYDQVSRQQLGDVMFNQTKIMVVASLIILTSVVTAHSPAIQESEESRRNAENNRKYIASLVERAEKELEGKDAKACYAWAQNPPQWTSHQGKGHFQPFREILEKVYSLSIHRDPTFAPAYAARGQLLGSEADLNKALELAPDYIDVMMTRGRFHLLERPEQAVGNFTQAIKRLKTHPDNVQAISGVHLKLERKLNLCHAFHDRAIAQLLLGKREQAVDDVTQAIAVSLEDRELKKLFDRSASEWMLQLAWVSVVHPDDKLRNVPFAEQCVSKAREYARKEPKNKGYLDTLYQFEIIEAAIAAEKGDFQRALELESKVRYGAIQWGEPGGRHSARMMQYETQKPIRTKSIWYL